MRQKEMVVTTERPVGFQVALDAARGDFTESAAAVIVTTVTLGSDHQDSGKKKKKTCALKRLTLHVN